jgi:hypothetical protein
MHHVLQRVTELRPLKLESILRQPLRDDIATEEGKIWVGAEE